MKKICLISMFLLAATSCRSTSPDDQNSLVKSDRQNKNLSNEPAEFQDAKVQRISFVIDDSLSMEVLKEAKGDFGYEINFGKLSLDGFNRLVDHFKKKEALSYVELKEYKLFDFLPSKMQALLNKRLIATTRPAIELDDVDLFYKNYGKVYKGINCWGTAWEMIRDSSAETPFNTFMSSRRHTQKAFEELGELVDASESPRYGDTIVWLTKENKSKKMQHAAIYLANNYYFEKTDAGSEMFFRIVHYDDMKERLEITFEDAIDNFGQPIEVDSEIIRFEKPLPHPKEIFSAKFTQDIGEREYADALPKSENPETVTIFADDRLGGGNEMTVQDMSTFKILVNPVTNIGELDTTDLNSKNLVESK